MEKKMVTIFTDGSSRGNPGPGGYGAVVAYPDRVVEIGDREVHTTNNRMELLAAISALKSLEKENALPIEIFSDSKYVIHGITEWVHGWIKNNWINSQKKPVENRDLWERLFELSQKFHITWSYVAGHSGHPANERCDEIATSFADEDPTLLYSGPRATYAVSLDAPAEYTKASGKPFYLSMVSGVVEEHTTWAECEKRVKGKSGVKFKKVKSRAEADSALKVWGAVAK